MDVLEAMETRRSIRRYAAKPVPEEVLERILLAASCAPNAGNRQTTQLVVCRNAGINQQLGRINKAAFTGRISSGGAHISVDQPSIADDPSLTSAFYGAPCVVTLFGPRRFLYAEADCWIMASNIALAAHALGVGSCVLGRAEDTFDSELGRKLQREWGVPDGFQAKAHVTLGYLQAAQPRQKPRKYPNPLVID